MRPGAGEYQGSGSYRQADVDWVTSAVVKAPRPPGFENSPDGDFYKATIVNGGELYGTLRLQSKWNSRAAVAAAITVSLQVAGNFFSLFSAL